MKERLWSVDFLKGLSALFMVQIHVLETWTNQNVFDTNTGLILRFLNNTPAVVVFMVLMGYLISYTKASSEKLILRGLKVFFWGILLNIGLNLHHLIRLFIYPEYGNPLHAIFAVDIFALAGLSLIFLGLITMIRINPWIIAGIALVIAAVTPLVNNWTDRVMSDSFFMAYFGGTSEWSFFPVFPWLAYPVIGLSIGLLQTKNFRIFSFDKGNTKKVKSVYWGLFLLLSLLSLPGFLFNLKDVTQIHIFYHHGFITFLWTMSFTMALFSLVSLRPQWQYGFLSVWIRFIGKYLTRFYVIQWLIIGNIATAVYQQLSLIGYFAGFTIVIFVSSLILYLLKEKKLFT